MPYEVIITTVRDRADLLERTLRSMVPRLGEKPTRILVHEDFRPGVSYPELPTTREILDSIASEHGIPIRHIETIPGAGLGRGLLQLLEEATAEFLFYTQEDFDFLREIPVASCLQVMSSRSLNQVRWNKRKTMRCKGEDRPAHEQFHKVEVDMDGVRLCISDHWYFQASMWRRSVALEGFRHLVAGNGPGPVSHCEDRFNGWLDRRLGGGCGSADGCQEARRDKVRTFIWGGVGEPAFVRHTGGDRRSQGWEQ